MTAAETRIRTFARSLTWRVSGVALAILLTWYYTGDIRMGVELGIAYNAIRLGTHYFHDRAWARLQWGMLPAFARTAEPPGVEDLTPPAALPPPGPDPPAPVAMPVVEPPSR